MTAKLFEEYCEGARLQCISQELVNWGTDGVLNDCFSVFTLQHSIWSRSSRRIRNTEFMKEATSIKQLSRDLYTSRSFLRNVHRRGSRPTTPGDLHLAPKLWASLAGRFRGAREVGERESRRFSVAHAPGQDRQDKEKARHLIKSKSTGFSGGEPPNQ